jgi:hypothetical protein
VITVPLTTAAFPSEACFSDADACKEMHARTIVIADHQKYLRSLVCINSSPLKKKCPIRPAEILSTPYYFMGPPLFRAHLI